MLRKFDTDAFKSFNVHGFGDLDSDILKLSCEILVTFLMQLYLTLY